MDHGRRNRLASALRPRPGPSVPHGLVTVASWTWRLLLLGGAAYLAVRVLQLLWVPVLAVVAAVLVTALLRPVTVLLRRVMPGAVAALLTLLLSLVVVGAIGYVIDLRVVAQLPQLTQEVVRTTNELRSWASTLGLSGSLPQIDQVEQQVLTYVQQHQGNLLSVLGTGLQYVVEVGALFVLAIFVTFFLLFEGEQVWGWMLRPLSARARARAERAGDLAWATLTGYVHGTVVIAIIHGIVIGTVVFLLGAPLAVPLGVIVFLGSFLPIIGALVAGGLAVLVTLGTKGLVAALILLGVLIVENQLEAHLLQPLIVGRYVRLHPLAIGLALAVGTVLFGIVGALVAVPVAAIVYRSGPALAGSGEPEAENRNRAA